MQVRLFILGGQGESKTVEIRRIDHTNITAAVKLVTDVFMKFEAPDYSKEGIKSFFDTAINNQDFMNNLTIYGAYIKDLLVGVIATRNEGNHLALFFVDGAYHRQGIGRKLFEVVLENSTSNKLTVNASPYAKDVYHRLGFEAADAEQTITGIRFIPMIYTK